jgi:M61 glycyl aminopeptidase
VSQTEPKPFVPFDVLIRMAAALGRWPNRPPTLLKSVLVLGLLSAIVACGSFFLVIADNLQPQQIVIRIRIAESAPQASIEIITPPMRTWSFPNQYGGVLELAARINEFKAFDTRGAEVPTHKLAPGQFTASTDAVKLRYEVNLAPPPRAADAARVSWVSGSRGVLMLADLLPAAERPGARSVDAARDQLTLQLSLPRGWTAYSNDSDDPANTFTVSASEKAIIRIGDRLRVTQTAISGMKLVLVTDRDWPFADAEVGKLATDVLNAYRAVTGSMPATRVTITLFAFPTDPGAEKWSAETRGQSVIILLANQPSKRAALAQLTVPLTHELFHLWVPNGLDLTGNYDWFYEGFTVYQAARTGVRLGLITFQDFLNTIARAYDEYRAMPGRDQFSLIEASQRRWTVGEKAVYTKAMLAAFICDLDLRKASGRKQSLDDVYRSIFKRFGAEAAHPPKQTDGTGVVVKALDKQLPGFTDLYITRPATIDLGALLSQFGFQVEKFGTRTRLGVGEKLTRQQRDLLRDLGYNDAGRASRRK